MNKYIIKETTIWGDSYKARNPNNILRLYEKKKILQIRPFIDHYKIYAYKPIDQRGPAHENQTFIISYVYNYDNFIENRENEFIEKLSSINLKFYKEKCIYNEKDAYKILIMDTDVDLNAILQLI
jgi:hypothetical protein